MITIKFNLDGSVAGYDSDGNESEQRGTWSIDDDSKTGGYIEVCDLFKDNGEYYYHISKNMLVLQAQLMMVEMAVMHGLEKDMRILKI